MGQYYMPILGDVYGLNCKVYDRTVDGTGYENVGIWSWHLISFVDKPPKNFSKFSLVFKEDGR